MNITFWLIPEKNRKNTSLILSAIFFCCLLTGCSKVQTQTETANTANAFAEANAAIDTRPNVILILGDDIGYEVPTVNGGQSYTTPNIDLMAKGGMRFTQCYAAPDCSPLRFMLLTGKYNFRNYTVWGIMDRTQRTLGNMYKDAGYATCYAGKWQLDGGDTSVRTFGFDKYSIWQPYESRIESEIGPRYKSPKILQEGSFLPDSQTLNKYSVDIFTRYITNFMDSNSTKPFFVYYSIPSCHSMFCPTPDDAEWTTFDYSKSDKKFFPSMVKYMDKQIGALQTKVSGSNYNRKTIFIYLGDNGSPKSITSKYNGYSIKGEKGFTTTYGTHVPLIFYCPGVVPAGTTTSQLVDLTDFMPTLANLSGIPVPTTYGTLDGKDFSQLATGTTTASSRDYVFLHFRPALNPNGTSRLSRYAGTSNYKLYDISGKFYNVITDIEEKYPLTDASLTPAELQTKQYLQQVISTMHN